MELRYESVAVQPGHFFATTQLASFVVSRDNLLGAFSHCRVKSLWRLPNDWLSSPLLSYRMLGYHPPPHLLVPGPVGPVELTVGVKIYWRHPPQLNKG